VAVGWLVVEEMVQEIWASERVDAEAMAADVEAPCSPVDEDEVLTVVVEMAAAGD
jgi:hypothetical protein